MATQTIKKKDLKVIYDKICQGWQQQLDKILLWSESSEVEIEEQLITKGYSEANAEQKKLIEKYFKINTPKSVTDKIKDINSVLEITNEKLNLPYKKPKNEQEKSINAQYLLFLICTAYNGNWKADIKNTSQPKWYVYKYFSGGVLSWSVSYCCYYACLPAGLHFEKKEYAEDAKIKFKEIFEDYFQI